jgi:uncharacterized protein involved in exopolysaccharide biosynthesis
MALRTSLDRLYRHRYLVAGILAVGALFVVAVVVLSRPHYTAQATIFMVAEPPEQQNDRVPSTATTPILVGDLPALVQSTTLMSRAARDVASPASPEGFGLQVRAKVDSSSNFMTIAFTANSPDGAIAGANAVAAELVRSYREIATSRFDSLAADLRSQLQAVRASLATDDEALAAAVRRYPYTDTQGPGESNGQSAYATVADLEKERDAAAAAAAGSSELARVDATILVQLVPLARSEVGARDPSYQRLRDQLALDVAEYERASARYAPAYPGMPELAGIVAKDKAALAVAGAAIDRAPLVDSPTYAAALSDATKAAAIAASDAAKLEALNAQISALEAAVGPLGAGANVARIRRDQDAASESYALLSTRLAATLADRAEAASTGSVVIADRASFAKRAGLGTTAAEVFVLVLLVVWLAYGIPLLVESLDRRFRVPAHIEDVYGVPIVAVL